jgi:Fur family zinc uptake transcriptional regulator
MSHAAHDRTVPHSQHDHSPCIDEALEQARSLCEQRGVKLTQLREKVLSLVWSGHQPRGAYAMMEDMARDGRRVAPLTVYRALEFLEEHGLVHRVESLNAYVGCPEPGRPHSGQFLVCSRCGNAAELNDPLIAASIQAGAERIGFTVQRQTVEVSGVCPACLTKA